jgi:two-component system copper resistance phosphate regulon response regulator CusR
MKVLLVEDEERIVSFLRKGLTKHGFDVALASTGREALEQAAAADIVILDLGLPDMDGLDVLSALRTADVDVQVIVLTARSDVDDRVEGLERGADDYLAKPFAFEELIARIRARVRSLEERQRRVLRHGDVRMDLMTRRVTVQEIPVELSAREFAVLEAFLHEPATVLSRPALLSRVWGLEFDPHSNVVEVYIRTLRKKLGADRIETVKGRGYRLVASA